MRKKSAKIVKTLIKHQMRLNPLSPVSEEVKTFFVPLIEENEGLVRRIEEVNTPPLMEGIGRSKQSIVLVI